jgi:hypothetical protein
MSDLKEQIEVAIRSAHRDAWSENKADDKDMHVSFVDAALAAIEAAGYAIVPVEPTAAMLHAVKPFPFELCKERGDVQYTRNMEAATAAERFACASDWRAMVQTGKVKP